MTQRDLDLTMRPVEADPAAWERLVSKVLGASLESLTSRLRDGIALRPLATRRDWPTDASGLPGAPPFTRGTAAARERWQLCQIYAHPDPRIANAEILDDAAHGTTALWLKLNDGVGSDGIRAGTPAELASVLKDVPIDRLPIGLDAGVRTLKAAAQLQERFGKTAAHVLVNADIFASAAHTGSVPDSIDSQLRATAALAQSFCKSRLSWRAVGIDSRPFHNAGATPAQELAIALASGTAYLRALTAAGLSIAEAAYQIAFNLVTDSDFFVSIAKLRSFRRAWARVLEACGAPDAMRAVHIAAFTSEHMLTKRDVYSNILRNTSAAAAAALGGAEMICVSPFALRSAPTHPQARNIARATQSILLEESSLSQVVDPAGGAFAIERLSEDLAIKAWALFQEIERQGGMECALMSGFVAARIAGAWAERRAHIALRRERITGVSDFPSLPEKAFETEKNHASAPKRVSAPPTLVTVMAPLPKHFLDEDFEALRTASDAHLTAAGERPKLFVAEIGSEADYAPRSAFVRTLFESGGIECVRNQAHDAATSASFFLDSGIRAAALASSDAVYAERALAFAHEIKRAGARYLYFIGKPGALEEKLLEAGVDEFVYSGVDAIELLRRAHSILGLTNEHS